MYKKIIERLKLSPGSEYTQGIIRIVMTILLYIYFEIIINYVDNAFYYDTPESINFLLSLTIVIYVLISITYIVWMYYKPGVYPYRRIIANFSDITLATICMILTGEWGAIIYPMLLWVTFGNAFRYGIFNMSVSAVLSIIGFIIVIIYTPFWQDNLNITIGLSIGLIILPIYIGKLLDQKNSALKYAESANESKSQFLANMSHELRTPLNSIITLSDLSNRSDDINKIHEHLDKIITSGRHLLCIINDILDFSQIDSKKSIIVNEPFNLSHLIYTVKEITSPQIKSKDIEVIIDIDKNMPVNFIGDEIKLRQILINIVANAIKFTEQGSVLITTNIKEKSRGYYLLTFSINDTGIGLSDESGENIFNAFTQYDNSITRKYGGTGLGLSIAKHFVELMGGKIEYSGNLSGTKFWFDIWLKKSDAEIIHQAIEGVEQKINKKINYNQKLNFSNRQEISILVAEDNEINQYVYREALSRLACKIKIVGDGLEVLKILKYEKFDILILDHQMPNMGGLELIKILREKEKVTHQHLPIIVLTADISKNTRASYDGLADSIKTKPINIDDLLSEIVGKIETSSGNIIFRNLNNDDIIDKSIINAIKGNSNNDNFISDLLCSFIEYIDNEIISLSLALKIANFNDVRNILHRLEGSTSTIGANMLYNIIKNFHQYDDKKMFNEKDNFFIELSDVIDITSKEIKYAYLTNHYASQTIHSNKI